MDLLPGGGFNFAERELPMSLEPMERIELRWVVGSRQPLNLLLNPAQFSFNIASKSNALAGFAQGGLWRRNHFAQLGVNFEIGHR